MSVTETFASLAKLWAPPPKLTVSEWADVNRGLAKESSARPGQWKTRPYQREPMDAFTDPSVHTVVLMVARQTLKTEMINNCIGYAIDQDPGPMLVVQYRDTDCMKWSKIRFAPMVRETPCLRDKVSAEKSRSGANTIDYKSFPGGHLSVVASASPGNLAALPIRYLFCDEIDKYPASAGGAGDPISLAQGRQEEFWNRKTVLACTPTIQGQSRIEQAWQESDQREYELRCPICGTYQIPSWRDNVRFGEGTTRRQRCEGARYYCSSCEEPWDDSLRWRASREGRFRASASFNGTAGFRVSGLARLGTRLSSMVDEWLRSEGNPEARKAFINEQLAELWTEPGEIVEWERISERREAFPVGIVPHGGLFLTASVDVQRADGGRLEMRVMAYGENRERWMVDYRIFPGDPTNLAGPDSPWRGVESMLTTNWPTSSGAELDIKRLFVDSGDGSVTPFIYEWVKSQSRPRVWAIKGDRRSDQPVGQPRAVEVTTHGRKLKFGVLFKIVNSDFFKVQILADLKKRPPTEEERKLGFAFPQGYIHIPRDEAFGDEHCRQLCSEVRRTRKNKQGRMVTEFEQTRPRNEALDTLAYCDAGAWDYGANRWQPSHWHALRSNLERQFGITRPMLQTAAQPAMITPAAAPSVAPEPPRRERVTASSFMRSFLG